MKLGEYLLLLQKIGMTQNDLLLWQQILKDLDARLTENRTAIERLASAVTDLANGLQSLIGDIDTRLTAAEATIVDHEARITVLEGGP